METALSCLIAAITVIGLSPSAQPGRTADLALLSVNPNSPSGGPAERLLTPPAGARLLPGGRNGSSDTTTTFVRLDTTMSPAAIAGHYAAQLKLPDWRAIYERADRTAFALVRAAGATSAGVPVSVVLVVTPLEGGRQADVALRMVRDQRTTGSTPPAAQAGQSGLGNSTSVLIGPTRRVDVGETTGSAGIPASALNLLLTDPPEGAAGQKLRLTTAAPAGFPKDLLPAGAVVQGALTQGRVMTVVASAPSFKLTDVPRLVVALERAGWARGLTAGGFVGGRIPPSRYSIPACRGLNDAMFELSPHADGGHFFHVTVNTLQTPCGSARPSPFADVAMPLLVRPAGASSSGSGGGGGRDNHSYNARLTTTMLPAAIGAHYVEQMTAEGWQRSGAIDQAGSLWAGRFTSKSTGGESITSILVLTLLPESKTVDAWLRVVRR